ncbi:unnamed protein product, partial [Allacma fusca]
GGAKVFLWGTLPSNRQSVVSLRLERSSSRERREAPLKTNGCNTPGNGVQPVVASVLPGFRRRPVSYSD